MLQTPDIIPQQRRFLAQGREVIFKLDGMIAHGKVSREPHLTEKQRNQQPSTGAEARRLRYHDHAALPV
jgi:hypothetical protein